MRREFKRVLAALLGATMITPGTALADKKPGQNFCPTYDQVESDATGGSYVGGILMYETMGEVTRDGDKTTTTTTTTTSAQVGVPGTGATSTVTVTVATTESEPTTTTQAPIGFYKMNDGSTYEINCITGENKKVG